MIVMDVLRTVEQACDHTTGPPTQHATNGSSAPGNLTAGKVRPDRLTNAVLLALGILGGTSSLLLCRRTRSPVPRHDVPQISSSQQLACECEFDVKSDRTIDLLDMTL